MFLLSGAFDCSGLEFQSFEFGLSFHSLERPATQSRRQSSIRPEFPRGLGSSGTLIDEIGIDGINVLGLFQEGGLIFHL